MGMVQLMYHVSVHLNHNPEIHRASPWSSWHLQTPRNWSYKVALARFSFYIEIREMLLPVFCIHCTIDPFVATTYTDIGTYLVDNI